MRKWICLLLAAALLLGLLGTASAEDWFDCHCAEEKFSTKIPGSGTTAFVNELGLYGLRIYAGTPGYFPYIIINRRDLDRKFSNPRNYLNNVYREFLEEKYGDSHRGMNPAKAWEIGGKELLGARYMYEIGGITYTHLQLIDVRELGDVEYTAIFAPEDQERVMTILSTAVENYIEDEAAAAVTETPATEAPAVETAVPATDAPTAETEAPASSAPILLEPVDTAGQGVDVENGTFWTRLWGIEYLDDGGLFYADLYQEDLYPAAAVEGLKPGDQVRVGDQIFLVMLITPSETTQNMYDVIFAEDMLGKYSFLKVDDKYPDRDNYHLLLGGSPFLHFCTDYPVRMPLPNAFQFAWVDGSDVQLRDADSFISLLRNEVIPEEELTEDRTAIQFRDGLVTAIVHAEY